MRGHASKRHGSDNNLWREALLKMAAINRRAGLVAIYLVVLAVVRWRRDRKLIRKHRFWVREIFRKREELGMYGTLVPELRIHDREYFFR